MSAGRIARRAIATKGTTSRLPLYFVDSLLIATVMDLIAAIISYATQPDDNIGAAVKIVSTFMRPGLMTLLLVLMLIYIYIYASAVDERMPNTQPRVEEHYRMGFAARLAGWISLFGGTALSITVIYFGIHIAIAAQSYTGLDRPDDWVIGLIIIGLVLIGILVTGVPILLGILVLRKQAWARYALIVFCALSGVGIATWPFLQRESLLKYGVITVPMLLIWSELRERGRVGSIRNCWRGLTLLIVTAHAVVSYAILVLLGGDPNAAFAIFLIELTKTAFFLVSLLLAIWAMDRDANDFWAGLNASVVVAGPVMVALFGLIVSISEALDYIPSS